ncbi:MAG: CHAD domain-containing protein [Deltaproteobacteria bacterium]|nr:MAG: CHAD domain-containing protein [Deltaproteobacteria bacterium]
MAKPTVPRGLGPRTPLRIAAPRLLEARLGDVRKYEQALLRGLPAEPIHDMRVASRRLRAALDVFGLRNLEPGVKELQDALGAVRDLQLQVAWFARRSRALAARRRDLLPSAAAAFRRTLDVWRSRTAQGIVEATLELAARGRFGGPRMRRIVRKRLGMVARRMRAVEQNPDALTAHRLRIAVKKLRYCAELAGPALPKQSKKLLGQLVPLQEMLGDLHDMDVRIALLGVMRASGLRRSERARRARLAQQLLRELLRWQKKNLVHHLRREWD